MRSGLSFRTAVLGPKLIGTFSDCLFQPTWCRIGEGPGGGTIFMLAAYAVGRMKHEAGDDREALPKRPGPPIFNGALMDFAGSLFTLEINLKPILVFEAKWASEAEDTGRGWAERHSEQIVTIGRHGSPLPPIIKVRIARAPERAAYHNAAQAEVETFDSVKLVYLAAQRPVE